MEDVGSYMVNTGEGDRFWGMVHATVGNGQMFQYQGQLKKVMEVTVYV